MPDNTKDVPLGARALIADMLNDGKLEVWMFWCRRLTNEFGGSEQEEILCMTEATAIRQAVQWIAERDDARVARTRKAVSNWFTKCTDFSGGIIHLGVDLSLV